MGHNDVCQNHFSEIPTDEQYEAKFRGGMENLRKGLPDGATIYIVGIVDIYHLWEMAQDKKALGIVNCDVIWATSAVEIYPCATMLSPCNSETDRLYARSRNIAFNEILKRVTEEYNQADPKHYYFYTEEVFNYPFVESQVSDIDCFHPSASGQKELAEMTWNAGPFGAYQK